MLLTDSSDQFLAQLKKLQLKITIRSTQIRLNSELFRYFCFQQEFAIFTPRFLQIHHIFGVREIEIGVTEISTS